MNKKPRKLESTPKLIIYTITLLATLVYIVYRTIFTLPLGLRPIDIIFGLTGTGYFDLVAYQKYNDGEMNDYIPTDEELAKWRKTLPEV